MPIFRANLLNPAGRIMSAVLIDAETADAALRRVIAGGHPQAAEVWQGPNLLARHYEEGGVPARAPPTTSEG